MPIKIKSSAARKRTWKSRYGVQTIRRETHEAWRQWCRDRGLNQTTEATAALEQRMEATDE